jgi:hypothetical protein
MKHTVDDLVAISQSYFPPGLAPSDPAYEQTQEVRRQKEAHARARVEYGAWRTLLECIGDRFPQEAFPAVSLQNLCMYLQSPDHWAEDRCFSAYLWLPTREAVEVAHNLTFNVSYVVPYYRIRSERNVYTRPYFAKMSPGPGDTEHQESSTFSAEEVPFVEALEEEICARFPGHERMPAEIGARIVPGVWVGSRAPSEATIFDCLFSPQW